MRIFTVVTEAGALTGLVALAFVVTIPCASRADDESAIIGHLESTRSPRPQPREEEPRSARSQSRTPAPSW